MLSLLWIIQRWKLSRTLERLRGSLPLFLSLCLSLSFSLSHCFYQSLFLLLALHVNLIDNNGGQNKRTNKKKNNDNTNNTFYGSSPLTKTITISKYHDKKKIKIHKHAHKQVKNCATRQRKRLVLVTHKHLTHTQSATHVGREFLRDIFYYSVAHFLHFISWLRKARKD